MRRALDVRRLGLIPYADGLELQRRLVDGATADAFMADLKQTLEGWDAAP